MEILIVNFLPVRMMSGMMLHPRKSYPFNVDVCKNLETPKKMGYYQRNHKPRVTNVPNITCAGSTMKIDSFATVKDQDPKYCLYCYCWRSRSKFILINCHYYSLLRCISTMIPAHEKTSFLRRIHWLHIRVYEKLIIHQSIHQSSK